MLKLSVGDILTVDSPSGGRVDLVLTGIAEDYIFPRLYLSQQSLETLLGEQPEWNTVFGQTNCADSDQEDALRAQLLSCNYVSSVSFTEDLTRMFNNMVTSLNYVVILIIFCAAAPGSRGAVQPDQRQPGRAQKGAGHHQGAGLLR